MRTLLLSLLLLAGPPVVAQEYDPELAAILKDAAEDEFGFIDHYEAEVWILDNSTRMARYVADDAERLHIVQSVHREARRAGLLPELVLALIHTESLFDRYAVSRAGAQGLMQVMPFWKNEIGRDDDSLVDIDTNLRYGCTILRFYLDRENGNVVRALARYNGSLGKIWYPKRVLRAWDLYWE